MPSIAYQAWTGVRAQNLDVLRRAHRALHGSGSGVRAATAQINQAYVLMISAQFQGFCRHLHTECLDLLLMGITDPALRAMVRSGLLLDRKLDRGNPNPGNIGSDFARLGLPFWAGVVAHRPQNVARQAMLQALNDWRNAIAHQDFAAAMLRGGQPHLLLAQVQTWRRACDGLAESFDEVLRLHLLARTGVSPW